MLVKNHNDNSKKFMQKILLFIDSALVNVSTASPENSSKILMTGILNIRDALLAEIIRDNQIDQLNEPKENKNKKNGNLNQETELAKDQ